MRQYQRPTGLPPRSRHYFTTDGTFGNADEVRVFDTTRWTEDDWDEIDGSCDLDRLDIAQSIAKRIEREDVERANKTAYATTMGLCEEALD